ncbi:transcriptional regulator with XRE-family HTH domain [Paenibacillus sp. V4I7]|nr:transcriptional regulator with XRE-family HTH domain [Paenibacillus sp. V4I7]MDQ0914082.1 transcriptional regulator with XRE-family HTH domain [Paenibacillus sp. V4I5]
MTLVDLSERTGISESYLSKLERDLVTFPRNSTISRIANALNVPEEDLIVGPQYSHDDLMRMVIEQHISEFIDENREVIAKAVAEVLINDKQVIKLNKLLKTILKTASETI